MDREKNINTLSNIYWIGGSPCCGKSTISELLVKEFGFVLYKCDDHLDRYIEEGAAAAILPEFILNEGIDHNKYVCIVPTKEFQVDKYNKREWVKGYLSNCSDPKKAFENWMERDAKFAQIVAKNANDYKMNVITVDGSKSIDENYLKVRQIFSLK